MVVLSQKLYHNLSLHVHLLHNISDNICLKDLTTLLNKKVCPKDLRVLHPPMFSLVLELEYKLQVVLLKVPIDNIKQLKLMLSLQLTEVEFLSVILTVRVHYLKIQAVINQHLLPIKEAPNA